MSTGASDGSRSSLKVACQPAGTCATGVTW